MILPPFDIARGFFVELLPFSVEDVTSEYIKWLNDPEVVLFSNQRFKVHSEQSCLDYVSSFRATHNLFLKIVLKENSRMVGTMTAYNSVHHGTSDMGIMLGSRSVMGKGFGQDAWNTLQAWLFDVAAIRKVTGGAMRCNVAMVRIMERSGMKLEAVRPQQELLDGQPQDIVYFGKFRDPI